MFRLRLLTAKSHQLDELIAGQKYIGFAGSLDDQFDENGNPIVNLGDFLPSSEVFFTASDGLTVDIRLVRYDSTVKVCLKNGDTDEPIIQVASKVDQESGS